MKYVRFTGSTPYLHTSYIQEQIFPDDVTLEEIKRVSKQYAIDNATLHEWMWSDTAEEMNDIEFNEAYANYISACIDLGSWQFIDEE